MLFRIAGVAKELTVVNAGTLRGEDRDGGDDLSFVGGTVQVLQKGFVN